MILDANQAPKASITAFTRYLDNQLEWNVVYQQDETS